MTSTAKCWPDVMKFSHAFTVLGVFLGVCVLLALHGLATAPRMDWESKLAVNEFYMKARSQDYDGAYFMMSERLQSEIGVQDVARQWKAFIQIHGPVRNWAPTVGGSINVWPRFVIANHQIIGQRGGAGHASMRLVPEGDGWRVDQFTVVP